MLILILQQLHDKILSVYHMLVKDRIIKLMKMKKHNKTAAT